VGGDGRKREDSGGNAEVDEIPDTSQLTRICDIKK